MSALCNTSVKLTSILPIAYDGEVLLRSLVKQVSTENDSALAHRFPLLVAHMEKLSHVSFCMSYTVHQVSSLQNGGHGCLWVWSLTQEMLDRWTAWCDLIITTFYSPPNTLNNSEKNQDRNIIFFPSITPSDGGEPDGHDQFPGGTGEDAGDCGAAGEEEFEEGGGAVLSTPGLQHLWSAGLHRL